MSNLPEILRNLDKEYDVRPQRTIMKLPCGHGKIELTRTSDQYITCGECGKSFLLVWSSIGRHKQVYDGG